MTSRKTLQGASENCPGLPYPLIRLCPWLRPGCETYTAMWRVSLAQHLL